MDMRWLQDFLTVAELGNFTRSAMERHTSQTAFSRRIQALEAWLGVALIDRSVFPTRLTPEGEQFRGQAADILEKLLEAKAGLTDPSLSRRDKVRIALPHALALGRLPGWWATWSNGRSLSCQAVPGNVHDTVTSLAAGEADVMLCFHHAQQPIHLDTDRFDRLVIGTERLRPFAATDHAERWSLTKARDKPPTPLLMYSAGTYLGRMVDLIAQSAPEPLVGQGVFESDMADVLANVAVSGQGIAWLPDCTAIQKGDLLTPLGDERWSMTLSLVAYRDRTNSALALNRLWAGIVASLDSPHA